MSRPVNALIFNTEQEARERCEALDATLGLPKEASSRPSIVVRTGRVLPTDFGRSLRHTSPRKHPDREEWVVAIDIRAAAKLTQNETPTTLTNEWKYSDVPWI